MESGEVSGNMLVAELADYIIENNKSAIHVARLTIRVMDVRNIFYFSDRLIEDRRWQIR